MNMLNIDVHTFCNFRKENGTFPTQEWSQFGQVCDELLYLNMIVCKMEANGVTPIPLDINTACSAS